MHAGVVDEDVEVLMLVVYPIVEFIPAALSR